METEILTNEQIALLKALGTSDFVAQNFYLSGGTALAAYYLHHRFSEDLDFFSEQEFDMLFLDIFFKKVRGDLGITAIDFQQSYNRNLFFLHFNSIVLKTEFTFFPFGRIEKGEKTYGIEVDSLFDIAVNKLFTIYQRTTARDYIDLYCIIQKTGWQIADLVKQARIKFDFTIDPLQLGTQFIKAEEAKDYPRIILQFGDVDWKNFFLVEAKKLKQDILL